MRFNENSSQSQCEKKRRSLEGSNFALLLVVFKWHHGSQGVKKGLKRRAAGAGQDTDLKKPGERGPVAGAGPVVSGQSSMGTSMLWNEVTSGSKPDSNCPTSRSTVATAT